MRTGLIVSCIMVWCGAATCLADEPPRITSEAKPALPAVQPILREACEIVLKQDEHQHCRVASGQQGELA
jgi:hypothetical protein